MYKTILMKLFMLTLGFSLYSQSDYYQSGIGIGGLYGSGLQSSPINTQGGNKVHFSMAMGTSISTFSGYGSFFRTFLAPSLSYNLSPKMSLMGGAIVNNYFFNADKDYQSPFYEQGNITSTTLWLSSRYQINQKLSLTGTVYKDFTPRINQAFEKLNWNDERHGVILDLEFRPNKNMQINTRFEYHKGRPDYYNPFYAPIDPFYNNFGAY